MFLIYFADFKNINKNVQAVVGVFNDLEPGFVDVLDLVVAGYQDLPTLVCRHLVAPAEERPNQGKDYPHKY